MRFVLTTATIILLASSPAWAQEPAKTPAERPAQSVEAMKAARAPTVPSESDILRKQRNVLAATVLDLQAEVERMRAMSQAAPTPEIAPAPAPAPAPTP